MVDCPACADSSLVELSVENDARVELCQRCKGMLLDELALERLLGACDVQALTEPRAEPAALRPCLRCNTASWERRALAGDASPSVDRCATCGLVWLASGGLDRLRRQWHAEQRRARSDAGAPPSSGAMPEAPPPPEAAGVPADPAASLRAAVIEPLRVDFDRGAGNRVGLPLMLALGALFCSTGFGRMLAALAGMPFHELGHALTSWLSSRVAVPLPFFTIWASQQSLWFGLLLAGLLAWGGFHCWRERSRFGLAAALLLLISQLSLSWLVPARHTLMLQILGGGLGEIVLGAAALAAFHFPLPDRLRWDFWRWPMLVPAALCFVQALSLWWRVNRDIRQMPWGSAIGDESDGDMYRLVNGFDWSARELASFYLHAAYFSALGLVLAYAWAWYRAARASAAEPALRARSLPAR
jgi:Zn-finger nucleic acid-binding protein